MDHNQLNPKLSRREFLACSGTVGALLVANPSTANAGASSTLVRSVTIGLSAIAKVPGYCSVTTIAQHPVRLTGNYSLKLRRAEDLLYLNLEFINVRLYECCCESCTCTRCRCTTCRPLPFRCNACAQRPCTCYEYRCVRSNCEWRISPLDKGRPAYVVFHFPGQHVAESAVRNQDISCNSSGVLKATRVPIASVLSESSRLAFRFDRPIGLSLQKLLDWSHLVPSVVPVAVPHLGLIGLDGKPVKAPEGDAAKPRAPNATETSIILPTGLVISPHEYSEWKHQIDGSVSMHCRYDKPQTTVVERWETASQPSAAFVLKNKSELRERLSTLRAIHYYRSDAEQVLVLNPKPPPEAIPLELLPTYNDRASIVNLNAGFHKPPYVPEPYTYDDLRLSPAGGSLYARGNWPHDAPHRPKEFGNATEHRQDTVQSRDQFVQVVRFYYGCNIPFIGKLIQERTREFLPVDYESGEKGIGAVILERWFSKHIPPAYFPAVPDLESMYGRRWPFQRVVFKWPDGVELKRPVDVRDPNLTGDAVKGCWLHPLCSDEPLLIEATAFDRQGKTETFKIPMMFIHPDIATNKAAVREYLDEYYKAIARRDIQLAGQSLGFVPLAAGNQGQRPERGAYPVERMRMSVELDDDGWHNSTDVGIGKLNDRPHSFPEGWREVAYYPCVEEFDIRLPEIQAYSSAGGDRSRVVWNPIYNKIGFTPTGENAGELFLDIPTGKKLGFDGEKGGGLVSPSVNIRSLSRLIGAVGGSAAPVRALMQDAAYQGNSFGKKKFDPKEFMPTDATLIGGIKLKDILELIAVVSDLADVPQLAGEDFADLQAAAEVIQNVGKLVDELIGLGNGINPATINELTTKAKTLVDSIKTFAAPLGPLEKAVRPLIQLIQKPADAEGVLSFADTFAILADSLMTQYSELDLNATLVELRSLFNIDRLVSELAAAPINALKNEISNFDITAVILPADRLQKIAALIRNPDSLLDGSFFAEVRSLLAAFGLGPGGMKAVLRGVVSRFRDRIRQALVRTSKRISDSIQQHTVGRIRDFFEKKFPNALDPKLASFAHHRFKAFEDYLARRVDAPLQEIAASLADEIDNVIENNFPFEQIQSQLEGIEKALRALQQNVERILKGLEALINQMPKTISVGYRWDTELKDGPSDFPIFVATNEANGKRARLTFDSKIEKKLGFTSQTLLAAPTAQASIQVTDFQIVLIPNARFLIVTFKQLLVKSDGFSKPKVTVDIQDVAFGESLEFVQSIASLLSPDSGFRIGITSSGIEAGYALGIPAFSIGVFNLADLSLGVGVILPFTGDPLLMSFNVSERQRPCLLSVGIFGGTAFFRIVIEPRDAAGSVKEIEAALEFGAVAAVTLGPASGRLYAFGGIYYGRTRDTVTFIGYVRAGGCLNVLNLISASVEFYLALEYQKRGDETTARGIARVTVQVKIIFVINIKVTLTYEKRFAGSSSRQLTRQDSNSAIRLQSLPAGSQDNAHQVPIISEEWASYCRLFG